MYVNAAIYNFSNIYNLCHYCLLIIKNNFMTNNKNILFSITVLFLLLLFIIKYLYD